MSSPIASSGRSVDSLETHLDRRVSNFDFLRFVLATTVMWTHCYNLVARDWSAEPMYRLTHGQLPAASMAVDLFFVASGFLVAGSWFRSPSVLEYARNRCLRILPGLFTAAVLTALVFGPLGADSKWEYFHDHRTYSFIVRQVLFHADPTLYGTFQHSRTPALPLGSLATLPYEVLCYGAIVLLSSMGLLRSGRRFAGVFVCLWVAHGLGIGFSAALRFFPISPFYAPRVFVYFAAGLMAYLFKDCIRLTPALAWLSVLALLATLRAGLCWTLPVCGSYLLFFVAYWRRLPLQEFGRFGDMSYGMFLYGYLMQQLVVQFWPTVQPGALFLTAVFPAVLMAALSWRLVEKPCLKLKRRSRSGA